jgi:thioredoxin reductase (NADPH)
MPEKSLEFDIIIIGGGPAALAASVWSADLGLSSIMLERAPELGGQMLKIYNRIANYLGAGAANGRELFGRFLDTGEQMGVRYRSNSEVVAIDTKALTITLGGGETLRGEVLVIATGVSRRKLHVEGEDEFENKGILRSGQRDRELVKNKRLLIVGGGDAAFENAQLLSPTAAETYLVHRRSEFSARPAFVESAKRSPVNVLTNTVVTRINGSESVQSVDLLNLRDRSVRVLEIDNILIRIGVEANSKLVAGQIELDPHGYIVVDRECRTSVAGVYAVGDVANPVSPTISTAVGMGATAVKAAFRELKK